MSKTQKFAGSFAILFLGSVVWFALRFLTNNFGTPLLFDVVSAGVSLLTAFFIVFLWIEPADYRN